MTQTNPDKFFKWLDDMEKETGLSDRQVAKRGNFAPSLLSKHRKQVTIPGYDLCAKIAMAFRMDPIDVFRLAGLLLPPANYDPEYELIKDWFDLLTPDQKELFRNAVWVTIEKKFKK